MKMDYQCPMCGRVIPSATTTPEGRTQINAAFFPFCSERCRLRDLGAWLDGQYSVPAEPDVNSDTDDNALTDTDF
jgi:hypothetical protein